MTVNVPDQKRPDAVRRRLEERRPAIVGEEVDDRDLAEELDRRNDQRDDDADGRRHGDQGAEGEDDLDDVLAPAPAFGAQPDRCRLRAYGGVLRRHALLYVPADSSVERFVATWSSGTGMKSASSASWIEFVRKYSTKPKTSGRASDSFFDVDEERAGERRVAAVPGCVDARCDAALAAVDLDGLERVRVLLEVRVAEVAEAARIARDRLHGDVVVLAGGVVGAARALLAVDLVGEVVERTRVGARARERERLVREARVDLVPIGDLALCIGPPDRRELLDGEARRPVVLGVDDDRKGVDADLELREVDTRLLAEGNLLLLVDRARGVRDVGLPRTEALEAAARAGDADGDVHARTARLGRPRRPLS